jgi:hypothetical protein
MTQNFSFHLKVLCCPLWDEKPFETPKVWIMYAKSYMSEMNLGSFFIPMV